MLIQSNKIEIRNLQPCSKEFRHFKKHYIQINRFPSLAQLAYKTKNALLLFFLLKRKCISKLTIKQRVE